MEGMFQVFSWFKKMGEVSKDGPSERLDAICLKKRQR
jgi:hypothetical protein